MLVDSHAHVSTKRFDADRDEVLQRARQAGLVALVDVGCDLPSSRASLDLAQRDPMVWATAGIHPHEAKHWDDQTADALRALAADPRVVAIGECGLDFHYDHSPREVQRQVFRAQLELAQELNLPVVLHLREGYDEALETLSEFPELRGVAHCFTGNAEQARAFAARGFYVSFTGVVTFKNAKDVQEAATVVPLELLCVETDCPYMAPVPVRGKRCEPAFVAHTADAIAALRGVEAEEVRAATARNAIALFGLEVGGQSLK